MTEDLNSVIQAGIALLPDGGKRVVFDDFKANLYAHYPNLGREAFARMIKADLIGKELSVGSDGKHVLSVYKLGSVK